MRNVTKQFNQRELARAAGVTDSCVSYILSGRRNPSVKTARKLAGALGMGLDQFFRFLEEVQENKKLDPKITLVKQSKKRS